MSVGEIASILWMIPSTLALVIAAVFPLAFVFLLCAKGKE